MLATEKSDIIVDGAFAYLNKFRENGVESSLPKVEIKKEKESDKEPLEMTKLRIGLFEIGRRRKPKEVKKKGYEIPEHLKKKETVDVLANYSKYVNFIGIDEDKSEDVTTGSKKGDKSGMGTWRDLSLDGRKNKLDEYFTITLSGVVVEDKLKTKIYKLVEDGKMATAKDVSYDKVNQRVIALPLIMKYDDDKGCFIEPVVDKALKKKRDAIKKAKAYFN